jgi:Na+-transporting NADH:ubiquinone oxidoreductase subunit C
MKTKLIVLLLFFLGWSCKENTEKIKLEVKEEEQETLEIHELNPIIDELTRFVEPVFSDSIISKEVLFYKELDSTGTVTPIPMDRAVILYKNMMRRQRVSSLPIFEVLDTNTAVLVVQGAGFGGAIWAKILIDKETLEIKGIAFEHKRNQKGMGMP